MRRQTLNADVLLRRQAEQFNPRPNYGMPIAPAINAPPSTSIARMRNACDGLMQHVGCRHNRMWNGSLIICLVGVRLPNSWKFHGGRRGMIPSLNPQAVILTPACLLAEDQLVFLQGFLTAARQRCFRRFRINFLFYAREDRAK